MRIPGPRTSGPAVEAGGERAWYMFLLPGPPPPSSRELTAEPFLSCRSRSTTSATGEPITHPCEMWPLDTPPESESHSVCCLRPHSMEFSRPEYCSGWPFPSPGDLPNPGMEHRSPALQADSLSTKPPGKPSSSNTEHFVKMPQQGRWGLFSPPRSDQDGPWSVCPVDPVASIPPGHRSSGAQPAVFHTGGLP